VLVQAFAGNGVSVAPYVRKRQRPCAVLDRAR